MRVDPSAMQRVGPLAAAHFPQVITLIAQRHVHVLFLAVTNKRKCHLASRLLRSNQLYELFRRKKLLVAERGQDVILLQPRFRGRRMLGHLFDNKALAFGQHPVQVTGERPRDLFDGDPQKRF